MKSKFPFKFLALIFGLVLAVFFLFLSFSRSPEPVVSETSVNVLSADEYEKRFHELAKERYEQLKKKSKGCLVAHADDVTANQIKSQTRYTDKFINGTYATGVGLGIDVAVSNVDVQKVGEDIELRFKSFYETTGKVRLLYQGYVDGRYQTLFTETVTCYCLFVPSGSVQWYNGTLTPPDMPNWSLGGVYPNDMCFERQLDTGDTQYFIARFYDPSTQSCYAINRSGGSEFGVGFSFGYNEGRVLDSTGYHTFFYHGDNYIDFVSSPTNNIDRLQDQQYDPNNLTYSSNISVSQLTKFYCSYIATNDRPENTSVINEKNYKTFNNYDYRKFPIYRITNKNYQSYDRYTNYETKYYNNTYVDNGLTIDPDTLKTTIDYDLLANNVTNQFGAEFKPVFDAVYELQPDVDSEFNQDNNVYNYPSIVNPPSGDGDTGVKVYWDYPQYDSLDGVGSDGSTSELPDFEITGFVPDYSNYTSQTLPAGPVSNAKAVAGIGWNLFDNLGLIPVIIPLVILGLLWKLTGGD